MKEQTQNKKAAALTLKTTGGEVRPGVFCLFVYLYTHTQRRVQVFSPEGEKVITAFPVQH